jgi:hypothetical protein
VLGATLVCGTSLAARQAVPAFDLAATLQRAGERVEYYFARAQSIVCLELVALQPIGRMLSAEGFSRRVQSELRVSWEPAADAETPFEAKTLRQVLTVNGHDPRENDYNNCTGPEQNDTETPPLSMLLPQRRGDYSFSVAGTGRQDGRTALLVDYRMNDRATVAVELIENNERCISFDIDGGMRGRIWIDAETHDVLRLDQGLTSMIDIRLPEQAARRTAARRAVWTMERFDTSIRFKAVRFSDPDETLILPVSSTSIRITRGSGSPRVRTTTSYTDYRRFLTGGRVVP